MGKTPGIGMSETEERSVSSIASGLDIAILGLQDLAMAAEQHLNETNTTKDALIYAQSMARFSALRDVVIGFAHTFTDNVAIVAEGKSIAEVFEDLSDSEIWMIGKMLMDGLATTSRAEGESFDDFVTKLSTMILGAQSNDDE